MKLPQTVYLAADAFANPDTCERIMQVARWPDGKPICPACGCTKIGRIATRKVLRCKQCRKAFSTKYGTLFERSPVDLGQWLLCLFALCEFPYITCQQLSDLMGVSLRSAWSMRRKLRAALALAARPGQPARPVFKDVLRLIVRLPKEQVYAQMAQQKRRAE